MNVINSCRLTGTCGTCGCKCLKVEEVQLKCGVEITSYVWLDVACWSHFSIPYTIKCHRSYSIQETFSDLLQISSCRQICRCFYLPLISP